MSKINNILKSKNTLIYVTALFLIILLVSFIWRGLLANTYSFLWIISGVTFVVLEGLLVLNLGFVIFRRGRRMAHTIMSAVIIVTFFGFLPLFAKWGINTQRRWFFQKGMQQYQVLIDEILKNKSKLKNNQETVLDDFISRINGVTDIHIFHIFGYTNTDGFVTIRFTGRGNYSRGGYVYYSGNKITNYYTNYNLLHLTNAWYEY